jgi:ABC-type cobalamin/Fe3+-siderophores transport system ATPase subunit
VNKEPLVEVRDAHFHYPMGPQVIRGISLKLEAGAMTAIIGSNGCGKSTLIRLMAGVLTPSAGQVHLGGDLLRKLPRRELVKRIAYVPQNFTMAFPFTALEVVLSGRTPYTPRFQLENASDRTKAMTALETVKAVHLASRPITELSGGERQIVSLARALAQEPSCLLLDEPSASLDLKHRAALAGTLAGLRTKTGMAAVVVTHDLNLIDPVFDRVIGLRCGEVVADGTPREVLNCRVLGEIYDDPRIRTVQVEDHTLVWSESA